MDSPNNITIRSYEEGDEEAIVELLEHVFNDWPHFDLECSPLDHWRWKFLDNPSRSIYSVVATHGKKIIGYNGGVPKRLKVGDQIVKSAIAADAAVHPDHREKGVWSRTFEELTKIVHTDNAKCWSAVTTNPIL